MGLYTPGAICSTAHQKRAAAKRTCKKSIILLIIFLHKKHSHAPSAWFFTYKERSSSKPLSLLLHILLNSEKLLAEIKIAQTKQSISVYEHSQKNTPYIEKRSLYETTFVLHYSQMQIFFVKHQLLRLHSCAGKIISICISHREIVRSEKKSASGNEHAKEACKRKPCAQKAACIMVATHKTVSTDKLK